MTGDASSNLTALDAASYLTLSRIRHDRPGDVRGDEARGVMRLSDVLPADITPPPDADSHSGHWNYRGERGRWAGRDFCWASRIEESMVPPSFADAVARGARSSSSAAGKDVRSAARRRTDRSRKPARSVGQDCREVCRKPAGVCRCRYRHERQDFGCRVHAADLLGAWP